MLNTDNKTALLIYLNELYFLKGNLYELINNDRPMPEELKDVIKSLEDATNKIDKILSKMTEEPDNG